MLDFVIWIVAGGRLKERCGQADWLDAHMGAGRPCIWEFGIPSLHGHDTLIHFTIYTAREFIILSV